MRNRVYLWVFVLALSAAVAGAQAQAQPQTSAPSSQQPDQMGQQPDQAGQQAGQSKDKGQATKVDDETLHRQVHEQLASNPNLQNLRVTVNNGVVTLEGSVPSKDDKKEAKKLAKSVAGVRKVRDNIEVSSTAAASAGSTGGVSGAATAPGSEERRGAEAGAIAGREQQPGAASAGPTAGTTGAQNEMTLRGCVNRSTSGGYELSTSSGQRYELRGGSNMDQHVGHMVSIIVVPVEGAGQAGAAAGQTPGTQAGQAQTGTEPGQRPGTEPSVQAGVQAGAQAGAQPSTGMGTPIAVTVTRVEPISDTCEAGLANPPSSGGVAGQTTTSSAQGETQASQASQAGAVAGQAQQPSSPIGGQASAQASASTTSGTQGLEDVERKVENAIRSESGLSGVEVDRAVILVGTVNSDAQKNKAGQIAEQQSAGLKVINELNVSGASAAGAQPPSSTGGVSGQAAAQAGQEQKPSEQGAIAGRTSQPTAPAGTAMEMAQVQGRVENALHAQPDLSGVQVIEAIVLSGNVNSEADKQKAEQIAQQNAGSVRIVNKLNAAGGGGSAAVPPTAGGVAGQAGSASQSTAEGAAAGSQSGISSQSQQPGQQQPGAMTQEQGAAGTAAASDEKMRQDINTALKNEPTLSNANVSVNVTSDRIILTGSVPTGKDRQTAKRIAQSYAGGREVVDKLTVTGKGEQKREERPPMSEQPPRL